MVVWSIWRIKVFGADPLVKVTDPLLSIPAGRKTPESCCASSNEAVWMDGLGERWCSEKLVLLFRGVFSCPFSGPFGDCFLFFFDSLANPREQTTEHWYQNLPGIRKTPLVCKFSLCDGFALFSWNQNQWSTPQQADFNKKPDVLQEPLKAKTYWLCMSFSQALLTRRRRRHGESRLDEVQR